MTNLQRPLLVLLFVLLLAKSPAFGQLPPGKDGYSFPLGGKAGSTITVQLGGADWTPDVQFIVHDPRVKLEATTKPGEVLVPGPPYWFGQKSYLNDPRLPREVTAKFTIPADVHGPIPWSVANANGTGSGGVFHVGPGDAVMEQESRREPQNIAKLPVTIDGRLLKIEEVDHYRFVSPVSGPITCELFARQLGIDLLGVLEVHNAKGEKLLDAVGTDGYDPVLTFRAEKGEAYTISVNDVDHRGYRSYVYRLAISPRPRVLTTLPAAGKRGTKQPVEFVGIGIATGSAKLESLTREVTFPNDPREEFPYSLSTPFGEVPTTMLLSDLPEQRDAVDLSVPVATTIRMKTRRQVHTLAGKKGDTWDIDVQARRIGSPLDVSLTILGPDGKQLLAKDDTGGTSDVRVPFAVPTDGTYQLVVTDVSGKPLDSQSVYRLVVQKPVPRFRLQTTYNLNLPIGGKGSLGVNVTREGGFKEPIVLSVNGLPAGVVLPKEMTIPPTAATFALSLECPKTSPAEAKLIELFGTAKIDGQEVKQPVYATLAGDLAPRNPTANQTTRVLLATTMKPPFKAKVAEADGGRRIPRGSTHPSEILIERTDGFAGEIVLDMAGAQQRHRQGIRGPAITVPASAKKIDYPVFLPEWLETTRTSRIGLNAMAQIPDPTGKPRWVMAAVEGQITMSIEGALMKLSCTNEELRGSGSVSVPLKLSKSQHVTGPVTVELVVPPELKDRVTAKPLTWPSDKDEATLVIESKKGDTPGGVHFYTIRATGKKDGLPVVAETIIEVEWVVGKK